MSRRLILDETPPTSLADALKRSHVAVAELFRTLARRLDPPEATDWVQVPRAFLKRVESNMFAAALSLPETDPLRTDLTITGNIAASLSVLGEQEHA